jgi:hypothetical protein
MAGKRALLALGIAGVIAASQARLPHEPAHAGDEAFVPRPWVAQLLAFGFEAVVADYHWLQAVQIVGRKEVTVGKSHHIGRLIDVVTTLDPWVDHPYRFAAVWMTDDEAAVRHANQILERGIAHHPSDWRNRFYLGFNHFFFLSEYEDAVRALEPAVSLPGAPRYLPRLVSRLRHHADGLDAAALFLRELMRQTQDEERRADYAQALREIDAERGARLLDEARERYRERHGRDIAQVADLLRGPEPVLRRLPPEPHGGKWTIDSSSGRIVSSVVGRRYEVNIDATNQEVLRRFRERSQRGARG